MVSNSYRDFGNKNSVPQNYLFIIGILFGLINGSSRMLWGYLMDKFGFKPLMSVIAFIEIIIAASFYFIVKINILIYILLKNVIDSSDFQALFADNTE